MEVSSFVKNTWKLLSMKILRVKSAGRDFFRNYQRTKGMTMQKLTVICSSESLHFWHCLLTKYTVYY